jgi:phage baseplate assembly protein V
MVSRAVVGVVNDAFKLQGVQVTLQAGRAPDDAEHFQHYGFTSVPHTGAEGIGLAVGGSTGHIVVINVDDRRYRLKNLRNGEVALYDDLGHKVHLTRNGIVIDGAAHPVHIVNLTKLRVEADIEATGDIKDRCDSADGRSMAQMRAWDAAHTHTTTTNGSPTSTPNQAV